MILSSLNSYYQRLMEKQEEGVAPFGYSQQNISYALVLSADGSLVDVQDVRDTTAKKPVPSRMEVPMPARKSSEVQTNYFWDKTSYALGVSADAKKAKERILREHEDFKAFHRKIMLNEHDPGLVALSAFIDNWTPEDIASIRVPYEDIVDTNVVFRLDGVKEYIHESKAVKRMLASIYTRNDKEKSICSVSGRLDVVAVTHNPIKGIYGAQKAGARMVSFNKESFTSYGKDQGKNAPVSEEVAFGYTTALNHLLRKGSRQRLQLGDTTVVFWAEASSGRQAHAAEGLFAELLDPPATDASEADRVRSAMDAVAKGRPLRELDPELKEDTQLHVLGLAPNASRLSVRFWETGSLHSFARRLSQHYRDLELDPVPWRTEPSVWRLLLETVPHRKGSTRKSEDIPPQLAGEMTRAILTGRRYPQSLLTNLIMRMRADGDVSSLRAALCKAVLSRDARISNKAKEKEIPMSLDTENAEPGYLLGRLFAALENVQYSALGDKVNATIRDQYYGAASATPAIVFPMLVRNAQHHLSRLRKDKPGAAINLEKQINEIVDKLPASFPKSLRIEAQGRFAIGYYHQNKARFGVQETNNEEGEE